MWQLNPYAIPLVIGVIPITNFALVAWRHRTNPAARFFWLFALAVAGLMTTYALELLSADLALMLTWLKFEYLFSLTIPVIWLLFTLAYCGYERWLNPWLIGLLFVIPVIHIVTVWTNEFHGLNWQTVGVEVVESYVLFSRTYGPMFWIGVVYLYLVTLTASIILIRSVFRSEAFYREQLLPLLAALFLIWLGSVLTIAGLTPIRRLDLTPFGYALACIPIAWSLFRFRLFDIMPTAHSAILQNMSDAVIVLDRRNRLISVNPAGEQLLRVQAARVIGQPAPLVFASQPELVERYQEAYDAQGELIFGQDEHKRYFDLRISPLRDRAGQLTGRIVVLRDITRSRQAEEMIRQYAAELEAANRELDAFSRTIAHDMRTPLTALLGYANMLDSFEKQNLSERGQDYLARIRYAGERMNQMIGDLLTLAKLKHVETTVSEVAMKTVVKAALERCRHDIEQRGVQITCAEDLPPALGHAGWLEEVFTNLISNAVKYIGKDNPTPSITVRGLRQGECVRYEVQDNGLGISPAMQSHLFEMFARFHEDEANGTGLGLSIVQRIITRLNGQVGVESTAGKGSTFWFTLPAPGLAAR